MSADLLAEFDTFYQAPQKKDSKSAPASNDLSFLSGTGSNTQLGSGSDSLQWQTSLAKPNDGAWSGMTGFPHATQTQQSNIFQNDIWGSFEGKTGQAQAQAPMQNIPQPDYGGFTRGVEMPTDQNKSGSVRNSTINLFSSSLIESSKYTATTGSNSMMAKQTVLPPPTPVSKSSYGEVLFDADEMAGNDDDDDDDDFGEFETGTSEPVPRPPASQSLTGVFGAITLEPKASNEPIDLLSTTPSFGKGNLPSSSSQAPRSLPFQKRKSFAESGLATKQVNDAKKEVNSKPVSPITAWPNHETSVPKSDLHVHSPAANYADEEWGDFTDMPPEPPAVQPVNAVSRIDADSWAWDSADQIVDPMPVHIATEAVVPPPTNIPPPSVILALFPALFDLPQSTLFKAVANQTFSLKNRIISDPTTIDFLRGYLLIATVAARVTAGRKLRWKRDTLLSQAMKIGPAAAGGKGGMKLTGVDKAEVTREDREAADVVRVWKEQLGRLRSAIAVANSSMHDASAHLAIPDISENMYVKTQERAVSAPKPCIICGLKREERINKVDIQVEDSFGEWWVDHWGHRACRNFWLEHEPKLKIR